jgi:hypothetical protein
MASDDGKDCGQGIPDDPPVSTDESSPPSPTDSADTADTHKSTPDAEESWRDMVGHGMDSVSTIINENLVAARYATVASIVLLSAYGISSTPLFFRFKTVKDIPCRLSVACTRMF